MIGQNWYISFPVFKVIIHVGGNDLVSKKKVHLISMPSVLGPKAKTFIKSMKGIFALCKVKINCMDIFVSCLKIFRWEKKRISQITLW